MRHGEGIANSFVITATSGIDHPALLSEEATAARVGQSPSPYLISQADEIFLAQASANSTIEDSFVDVSNNSTPPSAVPVQPHPTDASHGLDADDLAAKLTAHIAQIEAERIAHTAATDELIKSLRAEIATKATGLEASIRETQAQQNALTAKEVAYQLLGTENNKLAQECKRLEVAIVENIFRGFFTEVFNFFKEVLKSMRFILVILIILALLAAATIIAIELALKMSVFVVKYH